jgi:hypothetical protein
MALIAPIVLIEVYLTSMTTNIPKESIIMASALISETVLGILDIPYLRCENDSTRLVIAVGR